MPAVHGSPAPKMQMSADWSEHERAILERCCSGSSAHGTAHTEAQRLGMLACLATSNFKHNMGGSVPGPCGSPAPKMRKSADSSQPKGDSLESSCSVSSVMALLAQRHRDWGCLLVLPPQTLIVALGVRAICLRQPCSKIENVCR